MTSRLHLSEAAMDLALFKKWATEIFGSVENLGKALDVAADVGYTCETAQYFYLSAVLATH